MCHCRNQRCWEPVYSGLKAGMANGQLGVSHSCLQPGSSWECLTALRRVCNALLQSVLRGLWRAGECPIPWPWCNVPAESCCIPDQVLL